MKGAFWMPKSEAFAQKKSELPCSTTTLANHRKSLPSTKKVPNSTESTSLWWHFVEKLGRFASNEYFHCKFSRSSARLDSNGIDPSPFCCAHCTRPASSGCYPTSPACAIRSPICFGIRPASNSVQTFLYWRRKTACRWNKFNRFLYYSIITVALTRNYKRQHKPNSAHEPKQHGFSFSEYIIM